MTGRCPSDRVPAALVDQVPEGQRHVLPDGPIALLLLNTARPGLDSAPPIRVRPGRYFVDTLMITVLNPKSALSYFAFFPQFIDPQHHLGLITFAFMAATVIVLGFIYCFGVVWITHAMAQRLRARPALTLWLSRLAGLCLMGFGLRLLWSA